MCATSRDQIEDGEHEVDEDVAYRKMGIFYQHTYMLMGAYELYKEDGQYLPLGDHECKSGEKVQLLKLRNPHARNEWKGDWSDTDHERWTPELNEYFKHKDEDDGEFFMELGDFMKYYDHFSICEYYPGYKTSSFRYETQKNQL